VGKSESCFNIIEIGPAWPQRKLSIGPMKLYFHQPNVLHRADHIAYKLFPDKRISIAILSSQKRSA
jgi:hypothetical protein